MSRPRRRAGLAPGAAAAAAAAVVLGLAAGCHREMKDQARYEPLEASDFFPDGQSARPLIPGTVPRGYLKEDRLLHTGMAGEKLADRFPFPVTRERLARGRERFDIYCAPCHGRTGDGQGMIVRRGFKQPPSFHLDRLRRAPPGYFFDVETNGFGKMPSYAAQVPPEDRWAIAAYLRALQLSRGAPVGELPEAAREELEREGRP